MDDKLSIPRKVVKGIAMLIGVVGTCLCLMALTGLITDSGWVRVPVALVVTIVLPAVLADRVLPDTDDKPKGLVSDVFALTWLAIPLTVAVVLGGLTKPMLTAEGDRLSAAGYGTVARGAYLLAGVNAQPAAQPPAPPTGSASATSSAAASTPAGTAGPTAQPSAAPSATATATATASTSASAKPGDKPAEDDGKLPPPRFSRSTPRRW